MAVASAATETPSGTTLRSRDDRPGADPGDATPTQSPVLGASATQSPVLGASATQSPVLGASATTLAGNQTVEVDAPLGALLPRAGLQRGTTTGIRGANGATSLALALVARALRTGSWGAVVGLDGLGMESAADLGVPLERLALVPSPGDAWAEVTGTLLGPLYIVVLRPPGHCRSQVARRLAARCRDRRSLLVVVDGDRQSWPEPLDLHLEVRTISWHGIEQGAGTLTRRLVEIHAGGRRIGGATRTLRLWLPGPDGALGPTPPS